MHQNNHNHVPLGEFLNVIVSLVTWG